MKTNFMEQVLISILTIGLSCKYYQMSPIRKKNLLSGFSVSHFFLNVDEYYFVLQQEVTSFLNLYSSEL